MSLIIPRGAMKRPPNCLIRRRPHRGTRHRATPPPRRAAAGSRAAQMLVCVVVMAFAQHLPGPAGWTLFGMALGCAATVLIKDYRQSVRHAPKETS